MMRNTMFSGLRLKIRNPWRVPVFQAGTETGLNAKTCSESRNIVMTVDDRGTVSGQCTVSS